MAPQQTCLFFQEKIIHSICSVFFNADFFNSGNNKEYVEGISSGAQAGQGLWDDVFVNGYNTYKNQGLPPGPISSPGQACLEAALYPEDTDYLFFVLKGDGSGEHNFAENASDFNNYKEDYLNTLQ